MAVAIHQRFCVIAFLFCVTGAAVCMTWHRFCMAGAGLYIQMEWKKCETNWHDAVSSAINCPCLKEVLQSCFVLDVALQTHYITLHSTNYIALHCIALHCITLHYTNYSKYTTRSTNHTTLRYTSLHLRSITLQYTNCLTLHYTTLY